MFGMRKPKFTFAEVIVIVACTVGAALSKSYFVAIALGGAAWVAITVLERREMRHHTTRQT